MIALSVDLGHARTGLAVSDKSGFFEENGAWYYYENGSPCYKGLYWFDGADSGFAEHWQPGPTADNPGYYYINSSGKLMVPLW